MLAYTHTFSFVFLFSGSNGKIFCHFLFHPPPRWLDWLGRDLCSASLSPSRHWILVLFEEHSRRRVIVTIECVCVCVTIASAWMLYMRVRARNKVFAIKIKRRIFSQWKCARERGRRKLIKAMKSFILLEAEFYFFSVCVSCVCHQHERCSALFFSHSSWS